MIKKFLLLLFILNSVYAYAQSQQYLFPVMKENKMGFINQDGVLVVPVQYGPMNNSDLPSCKEGRIAFVNSEWKYGVLDAYGKVIVPPKYAKIRDFYKGFACVQVKGEGSISSLTNKSGYINLNGEEVIKPIYTTPWITSHGLRDGMLAVTLPEERYGKNKEGYVSLEGKEYFSTPYYTAGDYNFGLAPVKLEKDAAYGFINKEGGWVNRPQYSYAYPFDDNGLAQVNFINKTWGLIDTKGHLIAKDLEYEKVSFFGPGVFNNGLMLVKKNDLYGFIDTKGMLSIPCKYDYASASGFSGNGFAIVNVGCTKTKDDWGFTSVKGGTWMLIDKEGKVAKTFEGNYDEIYGFNEGISIVKKNGKYGYINENGDEIAPAIWDERPEAFQNGLGRFYTAGEYSFSAVKPFGYMDKNGKIVWESSK